MDQRVLRVIALMQEDSHLELPLYKMAQSVHLSLWHLCHLFKAETGMSVARYLKSLRMQRAKLLLESTFLSVKEIMNKVGVSDESHFVRDFKAIYGLTPAQYRARHLSAMGQPGGQQNRPMNSNIGQ
ncbi:MAG TPA: AraC family transcriptional regulator [Pyrinomonadaceae bacterium]|jgi:transcriptional regulator GlxA family with amidase domain